MPAQFPRYSARLRALLPGSLAGSGVAHCDAFMSSTRQWLIARQTTRDLFHVTRYCLPLFVSAVTPSLGQDAARWTCGLAVTVVQYLVVAKMLARTRSVASRPLRAACYRRINHFGAALTIQFFEAALPARRASSCRRKKISIHTSFQFRSWIQL